MMTLATALILLAGCQDFETLDDACHSVVPGEGSIDNASAVQLLNRTNCYRRFTGLPRGRVQKDVQAAVESHGDYVEKNSPTFDRIEFEQSAVPGYTGYDVMDRLDTAGYAFDDTSFDMGIWELSVLDNQESLDDLDAFIDGLADLPFTRQIMLQPSWVASGVDVSTYDEELGLGLFNLVVVYEYPATQRAQNPVVYPTDSQVGVQTGVVISDVLDPLCGQTVGYPITITVGSATAGRGGLTSPNPYALEVVNASVHGPDGPIPVAVRAPGDTDYDAGLLYTAAVIPLQELEPDTEYTLEAKLEWVDGDKDVTVTYRTASKRAELMEPDAVVCLSDLTGATTETATTDPAGGGGNTSSTGGGGGGTTNTGEAGTPGAFRHEVVRSIMPGARVQ